jgi:hypothetical protein
MKIKKFNESIDNRIEYFDAFIQFIKGKTVLEYYSVDPYGDRNLPDEERYYGDGIIVEGNYKMISHGGGCSGEDCNMSFILSPYDKIIAKRDW